MKCSAYIATSADGFIARANGDLDWLEAAGPSAGDGPEGAEGYVDFASYLASVDCMIMGRKTMEKISSFNLTPAQWPYGDLRILVPSRTLTTAPENMKDRVELYSGDLSALLDQLAEDGHQNAYIDGGATIQAVINLGRMEEMIITQMPVLIGDGRPLFGKTTRDLPLVDARAVAGPGNTIQLRYRVENSTG